MTPNPDSALDEEVDAPSMGRSAALLSMGNVASRILGLLREMVIAAFFGATGEVSAFRVASQVPTLIYDLLAGGMLSAALVPTLSEYAGVKRRAAFVQLAGSLLSLFAIILAIIVLVLQFFAPQVAQLMARGFDLHAPTLLPLTEKLLRIVTPAVWLFSMAGVITGILYAQQRFLYPAMAAAIFNLGIVVATPLLAPQFGISSLVIGILLGSLAQFAIMSWDLHRFLKKADLALPLRIIWNHPAFRKIIRLYLPIAGVTMVSSAQVVLDRRLASGTDEKSIAWMVNATTLQQLPLGLISVAIGLASLPMLSKFFSEGDDQAYRETLGRGLRLVILLIAPAAVGLWLLGDPITRLIFERGAFTSADTTQVVLALRIYVLGMIFAAIDNLLNYSFYARNNTFLPSAAGIASILVYVLSAYALVDQMGYLGLVWSDTLKHGSHVLFMGIALWLTVGRLRASVLLCMGKAVIAAAAMAALIWGGQRYIARFVIEQGTSSTPLSDLLTLITLGGTGLLFYGGVLFWLKVDEATALFARTNPYISNRK